MLLTAATGVEHMPESAGRDVKDGAREATRLLNLKVEFIAASAPTGRRSSLTGRPRLKALDADVMAIEEAAASLRAMVPVPDDYMDDRCWP